MIVLNVDLSYLAKRFEINTQRLNQYTGKSIEEVIEAESSQNKTYIDLNAIMSNPEQLAQLLRLTDATNRFLIIKNLSDDDLKKVLQYLNSEDLIWGLQYFNVDKLIELLSELPQEELLKLVFSQFGVEHIVALMKTEELDKFLTSEDVEKDDIIKYFESLNEDQFRQLMFQVLGPEALTGERKDITQKFKDFGDNDFKRAMKSFELSGKMAITFGLIEDNPKYIKLLDNKVIARPFEFLDKGDLLKTMQNLDPKFLIPMVEELPKDLMQVIASQVDPSVFSEFLIKNFSDILSQISF